jgi:hypothetical protein
MTLDSLTKLCGPARCVIYCSKEKFDKHSQDPYGFFLMEKVVEYASGDYQRASLLGTVTGKDAFIVFDYDNPDHLSACRVLGFRFRRTIKPISVPAEVVHSRVNRWIRENELWQLSFPRQAQVCPNPVHPSNNVSEI